jgi:hypothetical protein
MASEFQRVDVFYYMLRGKSITIQNLSPRDVPEPALVNSTEAACNHEPRAA